MLKILIADDDLVSRRTLEGLVSRWGYQVESVNNGDRAWQRLSDEDAPPMALLDWVMPGLSGVELCRRVRQFAEVGLPPAPGQPLLPSQLTHMDRRYTYLMLLTSRAAKSDMVEGLEAGADDYLIKPINPMELRARLQTGRRIIQLHNQLLATQTALRERATRDHLTGIWNRRAILEILEQELARVERHGSPLTVLLVDLDHFKRVNDTHGHLVGDTVLKEAAARMKEALRQADWIGRYGGEEFLIVQPGCDLRQGGRVAERLRETFERQPIQFPQGQVPITLSIGSVAVACKYHNITTSKLLLEADNALYLAKQQGRNRVILAPPLTEQVDLTETVIL